MKHGDKVKITITVIAGLRTARKEVTSDQLVEMLLDEPIVDTSLDICRFLDEADKRETALTFESIAIGVKQTLEQILV